MITSIERRWLSVQEVAARLEIPYRQALALVQDGDLDWRLRNPKAPNRRIYQISAESVELYERNQQVFARHGRKQKK
jgi:hypothetical protein